MKFTVINEGFQCEQCGAKVPPHQGGSCRNHCRACLSSKHVDARTPGDRASDCHGLMKAIAATQDKKGWRLRHECQKCGHQMWNILAEDDDWDAVIELSKLPLIY